MVIGHTTGSAHSSLSPSSSLLAPCLLTYCITHTHTYTHTHTLTFLITVITKRWNEVIFLFPNNRLSKQQMNLLPPAMRNRHIIFKFQFILSRRLLSCGAATHTIVFLNIVSNQAVRRRRSLSEGAYFSSVVASVGECGWITFRWTLAGVFTDCARMGAELAGPPMEFWISCVALVQPLYCIFFGHCLADSARITPDRILQNKRRSCLVLVLFYQVCLPFSFISFCMCVKDTCILTWRFSVWMPLFGTPIFIWRLTAPFWPGKQQLVKQSQLKWLKNSDPKLMAKMSSTFSNVLSFSPNIWQPSSAEGVCSFAIPPECWANVTAYAPVRFRESKSLWVRETWSYAFSVLIAKKSL